MRRIKGGKLPIGKVDAIIYKAKYKFVSVSDIAVHIVSDGAVAEGKINMKGKLADVLCSFSFTNTDEMQKTKIKPGIHFNLFGKKSDEEKAAQQAKKEQKKQEKAAKKEARKAEKEQKKAERKALKEQRKAEKAQRKAEKAQRKAEKTQRKAERNAIL
jgi:flagellar biosynthesis GTPase FlhF